MPDSAVPLAPPETGAPLDGSKYRLLSPLGRGGMGHVWLAEHVGLCAEVVVKFLDPSLSDREDLGDRMRLEAQALGQLRHPNIVSVIDGGRTETGHPFIVMERLKGRTLSAELGERRSLGAREAIGIARQALAGLAAAHAAGVVHRDVKPSNLFLCDTPGVAGAGPERLVKLIDFGIAKIVGRTPSGGIRPLAFPTTEGTVLGTPTALSPEQAQGERIDHRADLYAVGLLLYLLVTGRHAFGTLRDAELVRAYTTLTPEPPSKVAPHRVPPELDRVILKALARRPEDRFPSAIEFAEELGRTEALLPAEPADGASAADRDARATSTAREPPPAWTSPATAPRSTERLPTEDVVALAAPVTRAPLPDAAGTEDALPTRTAVVAASTPPTPPRRFDARFAAIVFVTAVVVVGVLGFFFLR
jgi:serine/threonine-protein kinase